MEFNDAQAVEQLCYQMKLADYPRSLNRAQINNLFNGAPPYTDEDVTQNNIAINVNFLESTRLGHDARSQFYQAFLKPGNYFTCNTDFGPRHNRRRFSTIVTKEINRIMKRCLPFTECFRSKFALNVLHGIAPSGFRDEYCWCPEPFGVEDVMVPANTLLTMYNLPFFAIYRSFTGPELIRLTRGPRVDPAWNKGLVDDCINWIDRQTMALMGSNWPEVWSPEKAAERVKGDGGFYVGDNVPTIDVWDLYFWNDEDKKAGWNRRMILDSWSTPAAQGMGYQMTRRTGQVYDRTGQFLYNPGKRKWADSRDQIVNWQFADLSAVAPFRYHSVRSLGFLLYAVCHLQNRLRCKFSESVFEQLMVYYRIKSADDMQRALKVELANHGFIDDSVEFIKAADRYQVNANLVELGLNENSNIINQNANSNTANRIQGGSRSELPTATQWMGEEAKVTQLVAAGLNQAYLYQVPEYREIFRRFCRRNSKDPDVRRFQAECMRQKVPLELLRPQYWELEPERVMGAGNKTLELAIAQQLMQYRNLYDPEPQRAILRDVTMAITDDPARADLLVPEVPQVSSTIHDTELVFAALMQNIPITPKSGLNNLEVIGVMLQQMSNRIKGIMQSGGVGTPQDVQGLALCEAYTHIFLQKLAEDPEEKQKVASAEKQLSKLMNEVRAMAQRQQEQQRKLAEQNGNGQDPEAVAKIQAMMMTAKAKADNTRESHAQRTAQREIQFELDQQRKQAEHAMDLQVEGARAQLDLTTTKAKAEIELAKERAKQEQAKDTPSE